MGQPKLGVGFLGAGAVTQAIHLPALARFTQDFAVTHVNDITPSGRSVAARVGAGSSTSSDLLLATGTSTWSPSAVPTSSTRFR